MALMGVIEEFAVKLLNYKWECVGLRVTLPSLEMLCIGVLLLLAFKETNLLSFIRELIDPFTE